MKKVLSLISSAVLALALTLTASAGPLAAKKSSARAGQTQLAAAKTLQQKVPAKATKSPELKPKVRYGGSLRATGLFRTAANRPNAAVKVPFRAGARAEAAAPEILGSVTWSDTWAATQELQTGLYTVPTSASQNFGLRFLGPNANYGGVAVDGVYYACEVEQYWGIIIGLKFVGYDLETGNVVYSKDFTYYTTSMTYDPTTRTVYGISYIEGSDALVKITFGEEGVDFEPVANIDAGGMCMWNSIACDARGQLWGIMGNYEMVEEDEYACESSTLYKIDKETGALTKVGDTGFECTYMTDATFDLKANRLYWTVSTAAGEGFLTVVDTTNGHATLVYAFPDNEEVTGLYIAAPEAEEGAPDAVTDARVEFKEGSFSGTVSFTAPATLFDGTPATGALTYSVQANGEEIATGDTSFGAEVSREITMTEGGLYTFAITVANEAGYSPAVQLKGVFVGKDTPAAPAVEAVYDATAGTVDVSWTAVTATVNGGYMDAGAVTYTVTRLPDSKTVAENIVGTSVTDRLPEPEGLVKYSYEVVASCEGLTSQAGVSDVIAVGSGLVPPFLITFDSEDELSDFTILDVNGDGITWKHFNQAVRVGYNSNMKMDDWLISPPLRLKGGQLYDVMADLWVDGATFPETFEVKIGKTPTAAGMTTVILGPTTINNFKGEPYQFSAPLSVDADGEYYIGFHGISDADRYALNVDNFGISAPRSAEGPMAVADLLVESDINGALSVNISFTAPDKTINGQTIDELVKIELSRDGTVVKTWDAPAPGSTLTYTDTPARGGDIRYSVVAYNASGAGLVAEVSTFVGFDIPSAPANISLVETATPGEVTVSWDAVTTDLHGHSLPASEVTYQVYQMDGYFRTAVSEKISETSYTFQAIEAGKQDFMQFAVFAYTSAGEGEGDLTPFKPVGTPYTSFCMSSENDLDTYAIAMSNHGARWNIGTDETFGDVPEDADGNNCFFYMEATYSNDYSTLTTAKIDLSRITKPAMVVYNMPLAYDDPNTLTLAVLDCATGEETEVYYKPASASGPEMTWNKITVDLSDFAQKTVQLSLTGECLKYGLVVVDGWKVISLVDNDLAATAISAPAAVACGFDYKVDVTVSNEGQKDATEFTVALYADGGKVADTTVASLAAGAETKVSFDRTMSALADEPVVYYAVLTYTADENEANNTSAPVEVAPRQSSLPAVTDLSGIEGAGGIELSWSEPDLSAAPAGEETVDFEDGDSWAHEYENWVFIDGDESPIGGFQGQDIPGINLGSTTASFFIFDSSAAGFNETFAGHNLSDKYLASMFRYDDGTVDDWAISPTLSGDAQTISFWARSYDFAFPEEIEVYYSLGGIELSDFVKIDGVGGTVPGDWTEYSFDVPAGARHFAVHSHATGSFMLMLDDFTFTAAGANAELSLVGYDVYRDGVKITAEPTGETEFVDGEATAGSHTYVVVTVYDKGVSAPSNAVTVVATGISEIELDAAGNAEYYNMQGIRVLNPEKGGLYIRRQDGKASKVAVK